MTDPQSTAPTHFEAGSRAIILDGMMAQAMSSLVGGAFLAAFALALGASQMQIGLLAALPPAGQSLQLAGIVIIRRVGRRKAVAVTAAVASRLLWLGVAAVPLFLTGSAALAAVALFVLLASGSASIGGLAWTSWMRDLIPQGVLGRFFSRRMMFATSTAIVVSLAAGLFVDWWQGMSDRPELAYSMIFGAGVALGFIGLAFLLRVGEPALPPADAEASSLLDGLRAPFGDSNFVRLLKFSAAWTFTITFAAPFYVVYLLNRIELPMSTVILLTVISQVFTVLFLRFWGRTADQFSNRSVLGAAGTILLLAILGWTFTTLPDPHALTMPLLYVIHAAMGLAMGGISLATGNIGLKLSPAGRAETYLTSLGLVNAAVAFLSPLIAGGLASWFAEKSVTLTINLSDAGRVVDVPAVSLSGLDFLFLLTFLLGLYAMHRLAFVQEEGSVDEKVVLEELREQILEGVQAVASFSALRQVVSFTAGVIPPSVRRPFAGGKREP